MSTESVHFPTFGAETETVTEIRSTSKLLWLFFIHVLWLWATCETQTTARRRHIVEMYASAVTTLAHWYTHDLDLWLQDFENLFSNVPLAWRIFVPSM